MNHHEAGHGGYIGTRREFLSKCGMGMGALAMGGLPGQLSAGSNPMLPKLAPVQGKAKAVIHLFMNGGPSQVDTFDPKPELTKYDGKKIPLDLTTERPTGAAMKSPFAFKKYGESGLEVSDLFPRVGACADDLCVIRSMHADVPNHEPSLLLMNCGDSRLSRPSVGSWVTYGLGTENQNLPGFVSMCPGGYPISRTQNWQSGFLPAAYQGNYVDTKNADPKKLIEHIVPKHLEKRRQREQLDFLRTLNEQHVEARGRDQELEARLESFELAYRMQLEATDAFDITKEPQYIRDLYGDTLQGRQMLIARRLIERGVRFVQVWHGAGQPWDNHDDLEKNHGRLAGECDQAIAALLTDLKMRGLLDETLVVWGGEFGRTPVVEMPKPGSNAGKINGRDHNHYGFTTWLAGGGVRGGYVHGETDDFGFAAVKDKVHVHDLHATMLHLLGFDHEELTYRYSGRDFRLTDVHGKVIEEILA
ncbi:MAG: DUF1501 domain-containing protein [Akkermansiaceae bacterium]|nr:DUF1501 domain-containing protein [Akkermansiaceae bacterium]